MPSFYKHHCFPQPLQLSPTLALAICDLNPECLRFKAIHLSVENKIISCVSPRFHKRTRQGQKIDLFNRFIFSTVSRPRGRPVSTYHMTDCD